VRIGIQYMLLLLGSMLIVIILFLNNANGLLKASNNVI